MATLNSSRLQPIQEFIASFAYQPTNTPTNPFHSTNQEEISSNENPPKTQNKKKNNSSYLRTTVAGKTVIVSRYFPLPPGASTPPIPVPRPVKKDRSVSKRRTKFAAPIGIDQQGDEGEKKAGEQTNGKRKRKQAEKAKKPQQLSAAEKKSDAYRRVPEEWLWDRDPPSSCYNLLQERHSFDPWRVLVICMLLNITTGRQVKRVLPGLFLLCRDAETATKVPVEEIEEIIRPLGLQKKRARMIKQFTCEYLSDDWNYVTELHGIGKYAADAYAIFCAGKADAVVPQDHKLLDYWKLLCNRNEVE